MRPRRWERGRRSCPQSPAGRVWGRGPLHAGRGTAPRKEPRTAQHSVPGAAAADREVRASPPLCCPPQARPGSGPGGGRQRDAGRGGAAAARFRSGAGSSSPRRARSSAPGSSAAGCGRRARAGGGGRGPRPGRRAGGAGAQDAGAPPPAPGRGAGAGRPAAGGAAGEARGRAAGGEPPVPRPPKEESGSHLLPRTRGEAAAAGGAPAPERLPPRSRAPASLRARCCSRPLRPPKRSRGPGRAGGGRGAGRGAAGAGAAGTLCRHGVKSAARRRAPAKLLWLPLLGAGAGQGTPAALRAERVQPGGGSAGPQDSDWGQGVSETFP